jgi:uncharacterized protein YwqG
MGDLQQNQPPNREEKELRDLIARHGLGHFSERLLGVADVSLRLTKLPDKQLRVGGSRFGGLPDVPANYSWPTHNSNPLGFLAQINCAEINQIHPNRYLPSDGLLHFFYDVKAQPWGFDPKDKGSSFVSYTPGSQSTLAPSSVKSETVLPAFAVEFRPFLSLPVFGSDAYDSMLLTDLDAEVYSELVQAVSVPSGKPAHQLFGHSYNIQNDMQLECQLASNGLYCGDSSGYKDPRAQGLASGASDWQLLLQFDSDDDLGVMWGDLGMIYIWIRKQDLVRQIFGDTWAILQCY